MSTTEEEREIEAMAKGQRFILLMVDDDDDDWILVKHAFEAREFTCRYEVDIHRLRSGDDLLDYLRESNGGQTNNHPRPDLILLDLNMPGRGGKEILEQIKSSPSHRSIPLVMYTTSGDQDDVDECYSLGANSFIKKPHRYDMLRVLMDSLAFYWMCSVTLPRS